MMVFYTPRYIKWWGITMNVILSIKIFVPVCPSACPQMVSKWEQINEFQLCTPVKYQKYGLNSIFCKIQNVIFESGHFEHLTIPFFSPLHGRLLLHVPLFINPGLISRVNLVYVTKSDKVWPDLRPVLRAIPVQVPWRGWIATIRKGYHEENFSFAFH